jgi:hypothetical protein
MSDAEDDGFNEAFKGFGDDPAPVTPPVDSSATPPAPTPVADPPKDDTKPVEEPNKEEKKDEQAKPGEENTPPESPDDKKPQETPKPPEAPETPPAPDTPQPLTKDDVQEVVSNLLNTERSSSKELETTASEVLEAYYPEGLSNVLVDERTGKELRTPQDVVDAADGNMPLDQAAQWLMNEQYKLDQQVSNIKNQAREIAETTVAFKRDSMTVLQKYEPLFKWQPTLQQKAFDLMMKQVKVDKDKGVILSAPDVMDLYDTYLEPYQQAYVFAHNKPATNLVPDPNEPPKPGAEDRMDEGGDAGSTPPNDPNDFAQQVTKELEKGI